MVKIRTVLVCGLIAAGSAEASYEGTIGSVDWDASAIFKNRTGIFTRSGAVTGEKEAVNDTASGHDGGDLWLFENSLNVFANADFTADTSGHLQLNLIGDPEGANSRYTWYNRYTQYDWLKELYVDTSTGQFSAKLPQVDLRLGKQQVVWGRADGIKLLDIVNPTDFRHFFQDDFEDSRITLWMATLETPVKEESSLELVVSQNREHFVPGLDESGDAGQPFIFKGVDSITGQVNGFLNITPPLGSTAFAFQALAGGFGAPNLRSAGGAFFTVQDFINGATPFCPGGTPPPGLPPDITTCSAMLNFIAQSPGFGGNENRTNLSNPTYDATNPSSAFDYLSEASFATFDTFSSAQSVFRRDLPSNADPNVGLRFRSNYRNTVNFSLNYLYNYDPNPVVSIKWEDQLGNPLTPVTDTVVSPITGQPTTTVNLLNGDGSPFQFAQPSDPGQGAPVLVFEETLERIHNFGASFDTAVDVVDRPVVLRGEFLYQKDVRVPVIDRSQLGIGNLTVGLRPEEADFFKYVLGIESTFFTNLLVSVQFIQFINLDYVNETTSSVTGQPCSETVNPVNCGRYTADPATLNLTNNLKKGEEFENFVSLFLSKPFGEAQRGRVNNIVIWEEGGGFWNRLDGEYELTDSVIGMASWNAYFGDENTTFGQFSDSSNFNVGFKLLFE